jgi:hypothetical protein
VEGSLSVPEREYDFVKTANPPPLPTIPVPFFSPQFDSCSHPLPHLLSFPQVEGSLSVPEREYDLVKTADVFNHFLTSRPTPLIPYIAASSQPFMNVAARGAALRAFLPGMPPGDNNIVQQVYIDLNIPVAVATLLNPVNGARLHQWCTVSFVLIFSFESRLSLFFISRWPRCPARQTEPASTSGALLRMYVLLPRHPSPHHILQWHPHYYTKAHPYVDPPIPCSPLSLS